MGEVVRLERLVAGDDGLRERARMPGLPRAGVGTLRSGGAMASVVVPRPRREAGGVGPGAGVVGSAVHSVVLRPEGLACGEALDAAWVLARLEEAGRTLLALPGSGHSTRMRTSSLEIVRTAVAAYGTEVGRVRPSVPSAAQITRMDEAFGWMPLIPQDRYVLRRIVGARCLVSPVTDRHLYSWRRLGGLIGADHKAVQRWHAQGIALLVRGLGG